MKLEVGDCGAEHWKNCVVGHFLDKKLPFKAVSTIVFRIWAKFDLSDAYLVIMDSSFSCLIMIWQ